jgi:ferritin
MTKPLISESLAETLYEQWVHETFNAHIYLFIAGFLKNKGLDNLAKHFSGQYDEELSHAKTIFNLLTDMNVPVKIMEIPPADFSIVSIPDIAKKYLDREVETTESLDAIKQKAIDDGNPIVEEVMRKMIFDQLHEMKESSTFMDKCEVCGEDWFRVFLWDVSLN